MSRNFRISSLLCLLWIVATHNSYCCLDEYSTHNYYMVSFTDRQSDSNLFRQEINEFWSSYTKGIYTEYPIYDVTGLTAYINSIDDKEMLAYVMNLNEYLDICNEFFIDTWDYPDKEDIEARDSLIINLKQRSKNYKGNRLRPQYCLLYMRTLMLLKQWNEIKSYWQTTCKRLPSSVYRNMMENIYAGALFHTGSVESALEIFSRQGDYESIQWSMRKYRNLAGIREIYKSNPNSPSLSYLLQDFVNNLQETIDTNGDTIAIQDVDRRLIPSSDALQFCSFADSVLSSDKVKDPCMWSTAQAMVYYLLGEKSKAKASITRSLGLPGSVRVKENSRCVNLLIASSDSTCNRGWLVDELKWLEGKCREEKQTDYCYSNAFDRIVVNSLSPMLLKSGDNNLSLAVLGMYNEILTQISRSHHRSPLYDYEERGESTWNEDYQNEFMNLHLYPLSASSCESYYKYITQPHDDSLSQYVCSRLYKDKDFFNDFIGTKYMAEAKFSTAIPFLKSVSLSYLSNMNVSHYMKNRDYHKERWLYRQGKKDDYINEGMHHVTFSSNPKLSYCQEILDLQNAYSKHSMGEKGNQIAYQLATLYYQASYKGDCWWLISYGNSSSPEKIEHDHKGENDFIKSCDVYLRSCLDTKDDALLGKCLYALAYTATDDWLERNEEEETESLESDNLRTLPNPLSEKYANLEALNRYYESHQSKVPAYMSKCDVLKQFRKMKWLMDY